MKIPFQALIKQTGKNEQGLGKKSESVTASKNQQQKAVLITRRGPKNEGHEKFQKKEGSGKPVEVRVEERVKGSERNPPESTQQSVVTDGTVGVVLEATDAMYLMGLWMGPSWGTHWQKRAFAFFLFLQAQLTSEARKIKGSPLKKKKGSKNVTTSPSLKTQKLKLSKNLIFPLTNFFFF